MPQDDKNPVKARAQEGLLATIDHLRMQIGKLVNEVSGDDPEQRKTPGEVASESIDEVIADIPPLYAREIERLRNPPPIIEMTQKAA